MSTRSRKPVCASSKCTHFNRFFNLEDDEHLKENIQKAFEALRLDPKQTIEKFLKLKKDDIEDLKVLRP